MTESASSEACLVPFSGIPPGLPALLTRPKRARRFLVLAHGAGGHHAHRHMERLAAACAAVAVATLRFDFPYRTRGRKLPGRPEEAVDALRVATRFARTLAGDLPLLVGGHSYGGRMASHAARQPGLAGVAGLVLFSFPLHPPGKPAVSRAAPLADVPLPVLILSGTRDVFATGDLLEGACRPLPNVRLIRLADADHGFVRSRGSTAPDPYAESARLLDRWCEEALNA